MPILPVAPPQQVPVFSGYDYVTVDAQRRRVYAAHGGAKALLIADADSGAIIGQVRVGPMAGVAFDPIGGHVFTGNGDGDSVSEVDPASLKVLHSLDLPGPVDAIAYDSVLGRIYADEDDGTRMWVIDAKTFKLIATITLPGHKPEYLAIDPQTHEVYQNIATDSEVAIIDPKSLKVQRTFKTPEFTNNHPLQYDPAFGQIATGGTATGTSGATAQGVISAYDRAGVKLGSVTVPAGIDQCDLDKGTHTLACAHRGSITIVQLVRNGAPKVLETFDVSAGVHTVAIDPKTRNIWAVWGRPDGTGDFYQRFSYTPAP